MNGSTPSLGHVVGIFGRQAVVATKALEILSRKVCELQRAVVGASREGHQIARVDLFLPNLELTLLRNLVVQDRFCDGGVELLAAVAGAKLLVRVIEAVRSMPAEVRFTAVAPADPLERRDGDLLGVQREVREVGAWLGAA